MQSQLLFAALCATLLFSATLLAALRADRRRQRRRLRLQAVAAGAPIEDRSGVSLSRPAPSRGVRGILRLHRAAWAPLDVALEAAGNSIGLPHLILAATVAAAAVGLAARLLAVNPAIVILLAGTAALATPTLLLRFARMRHRNRFLDAFPDALDLVGRAVKAGLPVFDAMEVAAREIRPPVGSEFQRALDEVRIGVGIDDALQRAADRVRVPDFHFYVVALALQRRTGGSLAETLANLSNVIRRRKELRLKARAVIAESKTSAIALGILPFVVGGVLFVLNDQLISMLFVDPRGRWMLGLALISLAAGIAVMAAIIKRALR